MSKKYESLAKDIIAKVGGKINVLNIYHCQTRLRFQLADEKKADTKSLEEMDGVAKVIVNAGVFQVVIGTHVKDVYEEIEKLVDLKKEQVSEQKQQKKNPVEAVIDFVAGSFQPIIPALSGAGMVKAVLALLVVCGVITNTSQTYYLLNLFADGVFYFLPMLLAFTVAKKLNCNPVLAASVAAIMMHPNWGTLVAAGEPVRFFEIIPFTLTNYTGTVIPIILIIFVQAYIEKLLNKIIPKAVQLVFVPMLTFLIMGTLAFSVLGPIGSILGGYLATFFTFLSTNASWAPALLIGGFLPVMVMFGLHNGVAPLGVMQMADLGYDSIFGPGCVCSNMAQATAGAVVALRTKSKKTKQIAVSGSVTAYMGITEPILYGVNLPKKYPLIAAMIGGGLGGLFAGLTHTHRFATGSSGLPAVFLYIGDDTMIYFINILIAIGISIVVTAVLTFFLSLKYEKAEEEASQDNGLTVDTMTANQNRQVENIPAENARSEGMTGTVRVPVKGTVLPLAQAADEAFSSGVLGQGAVIEPVEGVVYAPFDGVIETLFPTNHAVGITSADGIELLIHVGIDTVQLNGECFTPFVQQEERVKAGQKLIGFDIDGIRQAGYQTQTMVIVTNSDDFCEIKVTEEKQVDCGTILLKAVKE